MGHRAKEVFSTPRLERSLKTQRLYTQPSIGLCHTEAYSYHTQKPGEGLLHPVGKSATQETLEL